MPAPLPLLALSHLSFSPPRLLQIFIGVFVFKASISVLSLVTLASALVRAVGRREMGLVTGTDEFSLSTFSSN